MKITFDEFKQNVDNTFESLDIEIGDEVVRFSNPSLLPAEDRRDASELIKVYIENFYEEDGSLIEGRGSDEEEFTQSIIAIMRQVCTSDNFKMIEEGLGDNLAKWLYLWGQWNEAVQPGEA